VKDGAGVRGELVVEHFHAVGMYLSGCLGILADGDINNGGQDVYLVVEADRG
jgi:hypothetical protein